VLALLYKRTSKERRKGNPPTPDTLSLYTFRLPPSNHSPCFDVPSDYPTLILYTTITTLITTTTPHHPTSLVLATGPGNPLAVRVWTGKTVSVRFRNRPKTRPAASLRSKPSPVPVNTQVLPGLARPVGSNLRLCVSGYYIYDRFQISYC